MQSAALAIFLLSIVALLATAHLKNITLLSPYGLFIAFQCLYNLTPWILGSILANDSSTMNIQLLLAASANVAFALAYSVCFRREGFVACPPVPRRIPLKYFVLTLPLFLFSAVLCFFYGWHTISTTATGSALNTIAAYMKHLFIAAYLYCIYRFGLNRYVAVLFIELLVLMGIDGGRTDFLPVIILTVMIWRDTYPQVSGKRLFAVLFLGIFASIGVRAAVVQEGQSALVRLSTPITAEGIMGSASATNSIFAMQHSKDPLPYSFGGSYIVDPLLWLLPQSHSAVGHGTFLSRWERGVYPHIEGEFAPMGGFYYMAEALSDFGWAGPFIVTLMFGTLLARVERVKNRWPLFYLAFASTIGLLFEKVIFGNVFKLFFILYLFLIAMATIAKAKKYLAIPKVRPAGQPAH